MRSVSLVAFDLLPYFARWLTSGGPNFLPCASKTLSTLPMPETSTSGTPSPSRSAIAGEQGTPLPTTGRMWFDTTLTGQPARNAPLLPETAKSAAVRGIVLVRADDDVGRAVAIEIADGGRAHDALALLRHARRIGDEHGEIARRGCRRRARRRPCRPCPRRRSRASCRRRDRRARARRRSRPAARDSDPWRRRRCRGRAATGKPATTLPSVCQAQTLPNHVATTISGLPSPSRSPMAAVAPAGVLRAGSSGPGERGRLAVVAVHWIEEGQRLRLHRPARQLAAVGADGVHLAGRVGEHDLALAVAEEVGDLGRAFARAGDVDAGSPPADRDPCRSRRRGATRP